MVDLRTKCAGTRLSCLTQIIVEVSDNLTPLNKERGCGSAKAACILLVKYFSLLSLNFYNVNNYLHCFSLSSLSTLGVVKTLFFRFGIPQARNVTGQSLRHIIVGPKALSSCLISVTRHPSLLCQNG